jgi:hypothetical protein
MLKKSPVGHSESSIGRNLEVMKPGTNPIAPARFLVSWLPNPTFSTCSEELGLLAGDFMDGRFVMDGRSVEMFIMMYLFPIPA